MNLTKRAWTGWRAVDLWERTLGNQAQLQVYSKGRILSWGIFQHQKAAGGNQKSLWWRIIWLQPRLTRRRGEGACYYWMWILHIIQSITLWAGWNASSGMIPIYDHLQYWDSQRPRGSFLLLELSQVIFHTVNFYRTRVRSLVMLVSYSLPNWLTPV